MDCGNEYLRRRAMKLHMTEQPKWNLYHFQSFHPQDHWPIRTANTQKISKNDERCAISDNVGGSCGTENYTLRGYTRCEIIPDETVNDKWSASQMGEPTNHDNWVYCAQNDVKVLAKCAIWNRPIGSSMIRPVRNNKKLRKRIIFSLPDRRPRWRKTTQIDDHLLTPPKWRKTTDALNNTSTMTKNTQSRTYAQSSAIL